MEILIKPILGCLAVVAAAAAINFLVQYFKAVKAKIQ